jgi:hypothetical protein
MKLGEEPGNTAVLKPETFGSARKDVFGRLRLVPSNASRDDFGE